MQANDGGKLCSKCGLTKPRGEFYNYKRSPDGLQRWCKPCGKAYSAADRAANPEKHRTYNARYASENAEKIRAKSKAYYQANKEEMSAKVAAWRAKNPERHRENFAAWYKKNKEHSLFRNKEWRVKNIDRVRAYEANYAVTHRQEESARQKTRESRKRAAAGRFTKSDLMAAIEVSCGLCAYCLNPTPSLQTDHVIPIARGGDHDPGNVVMACSACNLKKGARGPLCMLNAQWDRR